MLEGDLEVLTGDQEDPTLLGEGSDFLVEAQTKAQEFKKEEKEAKVMLVHPPHNNQLKHE